MLKRKPSLAAIGLATGAIALEPVWAAVQKFLQFLNLAAINIPTFNTVWFTAQRFLENGYAHLSVINTWNYLLILGAVALEGPIATMLGGVWASTGRVNLWAILFVSMLAGGLADSFWYCLGRFGREQMVERWGRYLNVNPETIDKVERVLFGDTAGRVIFTAKLTSAMIIPTLIAAGLAGLGWRRVMRTMFPAQILWSVGLTTVGFIAADSFALASRNVEHFGWMVGVGITLLFAGRIAYRWRKAHAG